ncbi:inverse autotransporter beta domain-containing protein [Blastopirellula marina]|uniref:inverse autotransporter beta domain-containing protein n=1 Tax=Blastopirellula marina TaxID=124 RepID=UPI001304E8E5|nr:inverse autotransporter beta domain-containing protein [Blastopirellula marina]
MSTAATSSAVGQEPFVGHPSYNVPLYQPYVAGRLSAGNQRTLGDGRLFLPVSQTNTSLLFADFRAQMDDSENYEGNWGFGGRFMREDGWILGGYGYYDSRWTDHGNQFNQMTLGIEALSNMYEVRVNGYLPDTNIHPVSGSGGGPARASVVGNQLFVIVPGDQYEVAYYGVDFEAGALLMSWGENQDIEWRGFAGAYHFNSDEAMEEITGPRLRTELRLFDLKKLGEGSRVVFGAEYQWDQVREGQYFLSANVRIPFGPGSRKLNPLQRRMVDRVVRDVDIVSNVAGSQSTMEKAVYTDNGSEVGDVLTVTGSNAEEMINAASANQLIIVDGKSGDNSQLISPAEGVHLLGGGGKMTVKGKETGTLVEYTAPGNPGTVEANFRIQNDNVTIEGLTINGNVEIQGSQHITIDNSEARQLSVYGIDSSSVLLSSSRINASFFSPGVRLNSGELTIRDSTIESELGTALLVNATHSGNLVVSNSQVKGATGLSINTTSLPAANFTLTNSTFTGTNAAILFDESKSGGDNTVTMQGNKLFAPEPVRFGDGTYRLTQSDLGTFASENGIDPSDVYFGSGTTYFNSSPAKLPSWP